MIASKFPVLADYWVYDKQPAEWLGIIKAHMAVESQEKEPPGG